jgi:hypothetical protein
MAIVSAAQTTTSGSTTTTTTGGGGPTAETAVITALGVIGAALFALLGALLTSLATRRTAKLTSDAQTTAAELTSRAAHEAAKLASDAQLSGIRQQLDAAASTKAQERRFALSDRRLKRHEETVLALQDALAEVALAVTRYARARSSQAAAKGWEHPLNKEQAAVDSAHQEAYKLLQRLPRGSQAWTEDWAPTWVDVKHAIDEQRSSVLASKDATEQQEQLDNFENAIHYAQNQLGQALERLDEEIQQNMREEERMLSQDEAKPD